MAPSAVDTQNATQDAVSSKMPTAADPVATALEGAVTRFLERNPRSRELYEQAVQSLPGGNTRTAIFTAPFPVFMKSGKGYQVTSEDGHT